MHLNKMYPWKKHHFVTKVSHHSLHLLKDTAKFRHYLKEVGFLSERDEGIKVKGGTHRPLPPLDGRIQQPQNGVCFYEGRTPDLSKEE
jgi:hypothetical protein